MISGNDTTDLAAALDAALANVGPDKGPLLHLSLTGHLADNSRHYLAVWGYWPWTQPSDDMRRDRIAREILVELHEVPVERFDLALAWIERAPLRAIELSWPGPLSLDHLTYRWLVSQRVLRSREASVGRCKYSVSHPDDAPDSRESTDGSCSVRLAFDVSSIRADVVLGTLPYPAWVPLLAQFEAIVAELGLAAVAQIEVSDQSWADACVRVDRGHREIIADARARIARLR